MFSGHPSWWEFDPLSWGLKNTEGRDRIPALALFISTLGDIATRSHLSTLRGQAFDLK